MYRRRKSQLPSPKKVEESPDANRGGLGFKGGFNVLALVSWIIGINVQDLADQLLQKASSIESKRVLCTLLERLVHS
jgi:hypothetical protein